MSLGRSGPGVRSGFLETPRTRFGGVFLESAQAASQSAVPGASTPRVRRRSEADGGASTTLNGLNTYSGNTTITDVTAAFTLGATGGLTFYPAANGVTNMITGAPGAAVTLDGQFSFDTSGAAIADGNSWGIVDSGLATTYGATFTVSGFTGSGGTWTRTEGGNT